MFAILSERFQPLSMDVTLDESPALLLPTRFRLSVELDSGNEDSSIDCRTRTEKTSVNSSLRTFNLTGYEECDSHGFKKNAGSC